MLAEIHRRIHDLDEECLPKVSSGMLDQVHFVNDRLNIMRRER